MRGIPYMGGKRKLAPKIINHILNHNPNAKYFYDLFGGGGAVSFEALKRRQFLEVHYNELNTGVVNLLKHILKNGVTDDFYNWVSREDFHELKEKDDYIGGLVKTCWSFGGNQNSYIYGAEIEDLKKKAHDIIVNKKRLFFDGIEIPEPLFEIETINERRLAFTRFIKQKVGRFDIQHLEQIGHLGRIQHLEGIEYLERIKPNNRFSLTNQSFENVYISTPINETIIYLDPPYENTGQYQEKEEGLHAKLYSYIGSSPYKIYLSSYESPLHIVNEFSHRSLMDANSNDKKVVEKLFCNRKEEIKTTLF